MSWCINACSVEIERVSFRSIWTFLELHDFRSFYLALYPQEHWPDQVFCCSAWVVCDTPNKQTMSVFLHKHCENIRVHTQIEDASCCCLKANAGPHFLVSMICTHACRKKSRAHPHPHPHPHMSINICRRTCIHRNTRRHIHVKHTVTHKDIYTDTDQHTCTFL